MINNGLTSQTIKAIDDYTINKIGIPSMVLMERAALSITQKLLSKNGYSYKTYAIVCGTGNNGGDGLAVGRMLHQADKTVRIYLVGNTDKASEGFTKQLRIAHNLGLDIQTLDTDLSEPIRGDIVLDALFGIGLSRNVEGPYKTAIEKMGHFEGPIIAVDVPSGLSANTGRPMGNAVKADVTYTIGFMKKGFEYEDSATFTGELTVLDIGYPNDSLLAEIFEEDEIND
ncbi:MAG: NAD(P)H-hydrate epimerase [Alkalibacterium sp.]